MNNMSARDIRKSSSLILRQKAEIIIITLDNFIWSIVAELYGEDYANPKLNLLRDSGVLKAQDDYRIAIS